MADATSTGKHDLKSRLDRVEQALEHIETLYEKSKQYEEIEPDFSLVQAGRAAEAICKQLWKRMALELPDEKVWKRPPDSMMLDELTGALERSRALPDEIGLALRTIQQWRNLGAHDNIGRRGSSLSIKPCLQSLSLLVEWYFSEVHRHAASAAAPDSQPIDAAGVSGAGPTASSQRRGIVTGNRVILRAGPTVAARVVSRLNRGTSVTVIGQYDTVGAQEGQLLDSLEFKTLEGNTYDLPAGFGFPYSGETETHYRVELASPDLKGSGYVLKSLVRPMSDERWYEVKAADETGWMVSRYLRVY